MVRARRPLTPFFRLQIASFCVMAAYGATFATLGHTFGRFGAGTAAVGGLIALTGIARLATNLPSGALSERLGRRRVMLGGLALLAAGSLVAAIGEHFAALAFGLLLQAAGTAAYTTAALALVTDLGTAESRIRDVAAYQCAYLMGVGIGPVLGGQAAAHGGASAPFGVDAALALGAALAVRAMRVPVRAFAAPVAPGPVPGAVFAAMLGFYGVMAAHASGLWVLLPAIGAAQYGMSVGEIGVMLTSGALANVLVLPLVAPISRRWGRRAAAALGCALLVLAAAVLLAQPPFAPWIAAFCIGGGGGFGLSAFVALAADAAPPTRVGFTMGLIRSTADVALLTAPGVVGLLIAAHRPQLALVGVVVVVATCGTLALARLARSVRQLHLDDRAAVVAADRQRAGRLVDEDAPAVRRAREQIRDESGDVEIDAQHTPRRLGWRAEQAASRNSFLPNAMPANGENIRGQDRFVAKLDLKARTAVDVISSPAATNEQQLADLLDRAAAYHAEPLWPVLGQLATREPTPRAVAHKWEFAVMRGFCEAASKLVGTEYAERRVFSLINPALRNPYTTDTLYAGLQTIRPGEIARAHRHTTFALRFIMEGDRAYTSVEGEKVVMQRGDVVLTPQMEWHDHGNESDKMMIWMDGLDHPVWAAFPLVFAEHYQADVYPSEPATGPSVRRYPWAEKQAELDAQPGPVAEARYVHRGHGGEIAASIGASAWRIDAGAATTPLRETTSSIVNVYEGSGTIAIGDTTLSYRRGDIIAVPAWKRVTIASSPGERTYLFRMDDRPLIRAINAYRADAGDATAPAAR